MKYEDRKNVYSSIRDYSYYILIAIVSFASVAFLPFVGSYLTGDVIFPSTPMEWLIWIVTKLAISVINVIIFYSFLEQAKINIKDHPDYVRANETMNSKVLKKELKPRSPKKYFGGIWSRKGTTIFVSSLLSSIVLAEAILQFDLTSFLAYVFTVFLGLVFGFLQMNRTELYWVDEYPKYVDLLVFEQEREAALQKAASEEVEQECLTLETENLETSKNK